MSESMAPPPGTGGGNLKYAIVGVVLIGGAIALWFGMKGCEEENVEPVATQTVVDSGVVERSTALADDDLYIPEPEPDAGPEIDSGPPRVRYVTRYVGGGGGGNWNCSGQINAAAAQSAMASNQLQFRNCYERRLKVNNTLEGRVSLQVKVGRDGSVSGVRTGGTLRDPQVLSCVRNIAQRMRFPAPQGGSCAVVAAPLNFSPRR